MAESIPNLKKETSIQVQEAQRVPNRMNPNISTLRHIIIKMAKVKDRILKSVRVKQRVIYKGILLLFLQKVCRPEGNGMTYAKC